VRLGEDAVTKKKVEEESDETGYIDKVSVVPIITSI